jgi:anti-anti-sigma regulatory factor
MGVDSAVLFRQILVHTVRRVRPLRLILDLGDVSEVDPINLGTLAALCDLADDHKVVVFMENSSAELAALLTAAGVPRQRLRSGRSYEAQLRAMVMEETPLVASMSNLSAAVSQPGAV